VSAETQENTSSAPRARRDGGTRDRGLQLERLVNGRATSSSAAPAQLTVWRIGASVPSEVTWMNGVVAQFHKDYPAYAKTQVNVKWIPWTNATADWTSAQASGKSAPDITELGNTETSSSAG